MLPDGTIKQRSPLTGSVVWTVPGRANRPLPSPRAQPEPVPAEGRDAVCAFCPMRSLETTPEKARLVGGRVVRHLPAERLFESTAEFRRFPNLYPIVTLAYWRANHGYQVPAEVLARVTRYLSTEAGRGHLRSLGRLSDPLPLFAGTHDVITPRRHYIDGATRDDQLCSAGDLSPDEHYDFVAFTIDGLAELSFANPFVRYVAVFQNWLRPAGASFDHLHKQLVGIDEVGPLMERVIGLLRADPDLVRRGRPELVIARNDYAVARAGIGHRYPTIELVCTVPGRPWELPAEAVRGMSDLLHACHAATGRSVPTNEEWHYQPVGVEVEMPWWIELKWRVSTLAGFEGGTKINVNTISPFELRDRVAGQLGGLGA